VTLDSNLAIETHLTIFERNFSHFAAGCQDLRGRSSYSPHRRNRAVIVKEEVMKLRSAVIISTFLISTVSALAQDSTSDTASDVTSASTQDPSQNSTTASAPNVISINIKNYDDQSLLVKVFDQLSGKQVYSSTLDQGSPNSVTVATDNNGRGNISWKALQTVRDDGSDSLKCAMKTVGAVDADQNVGVRIDYGKPCN
jgi:hypothetical protein